jgi:hypothetical protein
MRCGKRAGAHLGRAGAERDGGPAAEVPPRRRTGRGAGGLRVLALAHQRRAIGGGVGGREPVLRAGAGHGGKRHRAAVSALGRAQAGAGGRRGAGGGSAHLPLVGERVLGGGGVIVLQLGQEVLVLAVVLGLLLLVLVLIIAAAGSLRGGEGRWDRRGVRVGRPRARPWAPAGRGEIGRCAGGRPKTGKGRTWRAGPAGGRDEDAPASENCARGRGGRAGVTEGEGKKKKLQAAQNLNYEIFD